MRGGPISKEESAFDFYLDRPTNDLSSDQANFNGNIPAGNAAKGKYLERTCKVGSYRPNRLGLFDMHGNVWQWCEDAFAGGRLIRGGAALGVGRDCVAWEGSRRAKPSTQDSNYGLRLARVPTGAPSPEAKTPSKNPGGVIEPN